MVTDTIKQKDVNPLYMNIHNWIRVGITNFAVPVCRDIWGRKSNTESDRYTTRNTTFDHKPILPLKKW